MQELQFLVKLQYKNYDTNLDRKDKWRADQKIFFLISESQQNFVYFVSSLNTVFELFSLMKDIVCSSKFYINPIVQFISIISYLIQMIPKILSGSNINGSIQKGNYIWAGAMNLAWNELCTNINHGPLDLAIKDEQAIHQVNNFNKSPFKVNDLSADSYYVKSGYGPATLSKINHEVKQKFPKKTFPDLKYNLSENDVISYAYLFKEVQYLEPFEVQDSFYFAHPKGEENVRGFRAQSHEHRQNVEIINYISDQDFIVRLKLKQPKEELYLIKGSQDKLPQDIIKAIEGDHKIQQLDKKDKFGMPVVDIEVERSYSEIVGSTVNSGDMKGHQIAAMLEKIKFKIDEVGAKVENEAVMFSVTCVMIHEIQPKRLILDQPFWIVMKQKGSHPYFVAHINNHDFMLVKKQ